MVNVKSGCGVGARGVFLLCFTRNQRCLFGFSCQHLEARKRKQWQRCLFGSHSWDEEVGWIGFVKSDGEGGRLALLCCVLCYSKLAPTHLKVSSLDATGTRQTPTIGGWCRIYVLRGCQATSVSWGGKDEGCTGDEVWWWWRLAATSATISIRHSVSWEKKQSLCQLCHFQLDLPLIGLLLYNRLTPRHTEGLYLLLYNRLTPRHWGALSATLQQANS